MDKLILDFELIPTGAWNFNLRTELPKKAWDILRQIAYQKADYKCSICNCKPKRLEAHEVWDFNKDTKVQKLVDIKALCHNCHSVVHINRTILIGQEDRAIAHFKKVNKVDYSAFIKALKQANEKNQELSTIDEWSLDINYLKEI